MIHAGFCLKIKEFNYTRCFDSMAPTSLCMNKTGMEDVVLQNKSLIYVFDRETKRICSVQPVCARRAGDMYVKAGI